MRRDYQINNRKYWDITIGDTQFKIEPLDSAEDSLSYEIDLDLIKTYRTDLKALLEVLTEIFGTSIISINLNVIYNRIEIKLSEPA